MQCSLLASTSFTHIGRPAQEDLEANLGVLWDQLAAVVIELQQREREVEERRREIEDVVWYAAGAWEDCE